MNEPYWMDVARGYQGLKEIPGPQHNSTIQSWLVGLKAWWSDDEVPWCGVFAARVMQECGLTYPVDYYRARAWANWGQPMVLPSVGCIAVFERQGGGHVGFLTGRTANGDLLILGGNQGNQVNVSAFPYRRLLTYRWPHEISPPNVNLALPTGVADLTRGEA